MDNNNNKNNKKLSLRTTVLAVLLFIAATFIICFGDTNNIPIIKTSGYMTAGLAGCIFFRYWIDGKNDNIFLSWKSCLLLLIFAVLTAIPITLLFDGKLW